MEEKVLYLITNMIVRLENKIHEDITALYDGYKQSYEQIGIISNKIDVISNKVDKQSIEILVIKDGKRTLVK